MKVDVDPNSGFCFGVVTAIRKAEDELSAGHTLYCLGDIVHNSSEVERLQKQGLHTITHADLEQLRSAKVLLRAHGEPPSTYETARHNDIEIIDATCPVVLQLQRRIKNAYSQAVKNGENPLILIYGKPGHAEVNGLVGQTHGSARVIQHANELTDVDLQRDILLYSQTTKSIEGFTQLVNTIKERKKQGKFEYFDTICRQVARRMDDIREFARTHEVIIFVSGRKSSNGKVLFSECEKVNPRSYKISSVDELEPEWTQGASSVGVCGATSTPAWLMNNVRARLLAAQ